MAKTFNLYLNDNIVTTLKSFDLSPLEAIKIGIEKFAEEKQILSKEVAINYLCLLFSFLARIEAQRDKLQEIVLNNSESLNNDGRTDTTPKE